jgi:hypothetical protein
MLSGFLSLHLQTIDTYEMPRVNNESANYVPDLPERHSQSTSASSTSTTHLTSVDTADIEVSEVSLRYSLTPDIKF